MKYIASHSDTTSSTQGTSAIPVSTPGVKQWVNVSQATAIADSPNVTNCLFMLVVNGLMVYITLKFIPGIKMDFFNSILAGMILSHQMQPDGTKTTALLQCAKA